MIPSYFKIEILAKQDEFVLSGRKGLMEQNGNLLLLLCIVRRMEKAKSVWERMKNTYDFLRRVSC